MLRCKRLLLVSPWIHGLCLIVLNFKVLLSFWWILKIFFALRQQNFAFNRYLPLECGSSTIPLIEQVPHALGYCKHLISDHYFLSLRDLEIQRIVIDYSRWWSWANPQKLGPPLDPLAIYQVQVLTVVASLLGTDVLLPLYLFPRLSPAEVSCSLKVPWGKAKQMLLVILEGLLIEHFVEADRLEFAL